MKKDAIHHPKMDSLMGILGIPRYQAVGLLEILWNYSRVYAIRGDIGRWTNATIAVGIDWRGDPETLINALVTAGWLDRVDDPAVRLAIHDIQDHADNTWRQCLDDAGLTFWDGTPARRTTPGRPARNSRETPEQLQGNSRKTPQPEPEPEPIPPPTSSTEEEAGRQAKVRQELLAAGAAEPGVSKVAARPDVQPIHVVMVLDAVRRQGKAKDAVAVALHRLESEELPRLISPETVHKFSPRIARIAGHEVAGPVMVGPTSWTNGEAREPPFLGFTTPDGTKIKLPRSEIASDSIELKARKHEAHR